MIINVPASKICDYYKAKKCSYMQVASHGFYILNGRDDFGLNKILQNKGLQRIPTLKIQSRHEFVVVVRSSQPARKTINS